jgi:sarcosine oxidase
MSESAIVVGAGIFGVSIANQLAGHGWRVTLVDQDEPGNQRATSSSLSRVIRFGHGADTWYTRLAWRARTLWRQLEEETHTSLLVEGGLVWFVSEHQDSDLAEHSETALRAEGIPVERLKPVEVAALYPSLDAGDLAFGVLEPAAGALHARKAVRVLAELAAAKGARTVRGEARPAGDPRGSAVALDGEVLHADRVVWACGPWLPKLFPGVVGLRVARCEYYYYRAPGGWTMPPLPIWYDFHGPFYGVFDLDGHGLKIAPDDAEADRDFDPQHGGRELDDRNEVGARAYLARRFPALAGLERAGGRVCQYELTPDNEFIIAPLPATASAWVIGGGSGHGFKHGPALGEYVERLLTGDEQPLERHSLRQRQNPTAGGPRSATADFPAADRP